MSENNPTKAEAQKAAESGEPLSPAEQEKLAVLTEVQPANSAVSEVLTGTPERPESTRIIPPGEVPASTQNVDPAEYREESQVAPTQVEGESTLHGNADY